MRDAFNKLIRRVLALTIRCPKKPKTGADVLRYALHIYLKGETDGLCNAILHAVRHYHYYCKYFRVVQNIHDLWMLFPKFDIKIAIHHFNGIDDVYWWPLEDWWNRYRYMRWLIREYNDVEL